MAINIASTKTIVERYLRKFPELRDNDDKLVANIWKNEVKELDDCETASDLLKAYSAGKLTSPDSITRARRKLQELNPDLRGETYHERKKKEQEVINDLKNF